jgi:hypothetical protein
MKVLEVLRAHGLSGLAPHAIRVTESAHLPLVILNYDQLESRKHDEVARECRGLVLERDSWKVAGRSFRRFFNAGECLEEDAAFHWRDAFVQEKLDGSLMTLFKHGGQWLVTTRGSFADGRPAEGGPTWEELFWGVANETAVEALRDDCSYAFELTSPYNQVVARHHEAGLHLLAAFDNESGDELPGGYCDHAARLLGVNRPREFQVAGEADLRRLLQREAADNPTFEGFVVRDRAGRRLKVKNPQYVALHHLKGNGNIASVKRLAPFVMGSQAEADELLTYFPFVKPLYERLKAQADEAQALLASTWERVRGIGPQKEFALAVTRPETRALAGFLFEARRRGVTPAVMWQENGAEWLIKHEGA